jgi:hypothetical protein
MFRLNMWSSAGGYNLTTTYTCLGKRNHTYVNIELKVNTNDLTLKNTHKRISRFVFKYGIFRIKHFTVQQWACVTVM